MTIDEIVNRLAELEGISEAFAQYLQDQTPITRAKGDNSFTSMGIRYAHHASLQQGIIEIAKKLGFSEAEVLEGIKASFRWHYDRYLRNASETSPERAARLDKRGLDQIPISDIPPKILPDGEC
jgi:hypothetical protein